MVTENAGFDVAGAAAGENNSVESQESQQPQQQSGGGDNPAWTALLGHLPEGLHNVVKPYLRGWDAGVNKRFEELSRSQQQYEPYRQFIENEVDPATLEQAYNLFNLINENPRVVWDQMGTVYGFNAQGQPVEKDSEYDVSGDLEDGQQGQQEFDITQHPQFQQMQQQLEMLQNGLQQQYEQEIQAQADRELDEQINQLRSQYGINPEDQDAERYALGLAAAGVPLDAAFQQYADMVGRLRGTSPAAQAPRVLPTGGGVPSGRVNPADLNNQETKGLLASLLEQANRQG